MDDLRFSLEIHEGEFRGRVSSCISKTGSSWVDKVEKQTRRGACIDRVHEDDDHALSTGGLKNSCDLFFQFDVQKFNLVVD